MVHKAKKYREAIAKLGEGSYPVNQAVEKVREVAYAGFDETVEVSMKLGVNPKHADQMVRGTVVLPHGTGKTSVVLAVCEGAAQKEAEEAGADIILSADETIEKIQGGWLEFDSMVTTPNMMRSLSKLGRVLGPRGLMPNPKSGTVTPKIGDAVKEIKAGRVEFRVDKGGNIHGPVGKVSFETQKLLENTMSFVDAIQKARPDSAKGRYIQSFSLSSTMGPGISVDLSGLDAK